MIIDSKGKYDMGQILKNKRYSGFIWHLIFTIPFIVISLLLLSVLEGPKWYLASSGLRILFGTGILIVSSKLFGREPKDILSLKNTKKAAFAGVGIILFTLYELITVITGFGRFTGLTTAVLITRVIIQQFTTGFYEEINYRFLLLEGLKHTRNDVKMKLIYVLLSSVLFGLLHCIPDWDTYTFLRTAAMGIGFAVIFVKTGNIIVPMIIHFLYDVIAHFVTFIEWNNNSIFDVLSSIFEVMLIVMVVISLERLIRMKDE